MLILQRRIGEDIVAELPDGSLMIFRVMEIRAGAVRVGISAPKSVAVDRREIYERKHALANGNT